MSIDEFWGSLIQAILSDDLKIKRAIAKYVPQLLTANQTETQKLIAGECFEKKHRGPDISWNNRYWWRVIGNLGVHLRAVIKNAVIEMALNVLSSTKEITLCQTNVILIALAVKMWYIVNFYQLGVYKVNGPLYVRVLKRLREVIRKKVSPNGRDEGHWIITIFPFTHRLLNINGSQKWAFHFFTSLPTHWIQHQQISSFSPRQNVLQR